MGKSDKVFLIKKSINGRCRIEDNWSLAWWEQWFYTFKVIMCILLNRKFSGSEWDWYSLDFITVGMHSFQKHYNFEFGLDDASFVNITVGHGWGNWRFLEVSDGWL